MNTFEVTFQSWTEENTENLVLFVLFYTAFMGTADNPNRSRSLEETRQALSILAQIDAISDLMNSGAPNEQRRLKPEGGTMLFNASELALLQRCVDAYVATVPFAMAKLAMKMKDHLDNAAEV